MADSAAIPGYYAQRRAATAKEKLYAYLESRPAGADAGELVGLLLSGVGSDPELGGRFIQALLGDDPDFSFDLATGLWSLRTGNRLKVGLDEARFAVVDIETTGGRPGPGTIIEIGAYRMTGRHIVDSFDTLVRPRRPIPRFITRLTSISNAMLREAPPIEDVLPSFREFMGDSVMVAHNAQFDFSFLDFEYRRLFGIGLRNPLLCTLRMSRRFVPSLRRRRLDLLAEYFGLSTAGRHRGLGDARMAAEMLAIFLDIAAKMGIRRLDRLLDDHQRSSSGRRIERHIAPEEIASIPRGPGVYLMRNQRGDLLYVGKARRLKARVSSYFTSGLTVPAKTADLLSHVWKIETRTTRCSLEAALLEARLIRELKPPYNRMLKSAAPAYFVKMDLMDPFPRLMLTRRLSARRGVIQLGPFIGRRSLDRSVRALARILGLRTCTGRLGPDRNFSPCIYGQMGQCAAPCNLTVSEDEYARRIRRALQYLRGRSGPLAGELARERDRAASAMRFEQARRLQRDLEALTTLSRRASQLSRVVTENNLVIVTTGPPADSDLCSTGRGRQVQDPVAEGQNSNYAAAARLKNNPGINPASEVTLPAPSPLPAQQDVAPRSPYRNQSGLTHRSPLPGQGDGPGERAESPLAYVVLSGRLALSRELDCPRASEEVAAFIAENYERYRSRPIRREELEPMTIVARWLRERTPDEARLIYLSGPHLEPAILGPA